jgi:hypothetical protein
MPYSDVYHQHGETRQMARRDRPSNSDAWNNVQQHSAQNNASLLLSAVLKKGELKRLGEMQKLSSVAV